MPENAVMFFTGRPPRQVLEEGGTSSWALNARRARKCEYAICTQNRHTYEQFSPTEPHGSGFMVGKISTVELSDEQPDPADKKPERYSVKFSEYAIINLPKTWDGSHNPVKYGDIAGFGIDVTSLDFISMPSDEKLKDLGNEIPSAPAISGDRPLSIVEAKKRLAMTFGISPDAIEITIRG